MEYNFSEIEQKWRRWWNEFAVYKTVNDDTSPKFYILDMFPYPSGAGLHVGHPLGYIASDIYARFKRQKGYNVLHPMGYDAFGLPAEQYALETGRHPADTTAANIARYREQLDKIGFSYDWSRQVKTSDPQYYKWTQWIFLQLFHSWYDAKAGKARPISELVKIFEKEGNAKFRCPGDGTIECTKEQWKHMGIAAQRKMLMQYRLAYLDYAEVWWCEALGTVLANDEVVNGVSERGGHPVVKKKMRQWFLRITDYAERLLEGLEGLDWTDAMKDMQRNWIGKSYGAEVTFDIKDSKETIKVFTTRPDTIFGVDFLVLAPEHELIGRLTTADYQQEVAKYKVYIQSRSERERITEVKQITGVFTGTYAIHPFTKKLVPIWTSEYVLAGYGTGAIMAVPSGDDRDHAFAKHFEIPVTNIFGGNYNGEAAYTDKAGTLEGSSFLNGLEITKAADAAIRAIEDAGIGTRKVKYRLRDANFSRQRYWGEPFPIIYNNDIPYGIDEESIVMDESLRKLPVELPHVDSYGPGPEGQGPLANITDWVNTPAGQRETNTMPGFAGSSWYFLRYMDPGNELEFASKKATDYWKQVDVYVGGTEHAVGHLLYARMWTKVLSDLGYLSFDEPFKKLVNQGMIQGNSYFVTGFYALKLEETVDELDVDQLDRKRFGEFLISIESFKKGFNTIFELNGKKYRVEDVSEFQKARIRYAHLFVDTKSRLTRANLVRAFEMDNYSLGEIQESLEYIFWDGRNEEGEEYILCKHEQEKMSKSKYNVVNPDDIVAQYGADTFRMYEMFLGPIDVSKPWDTQGIEGVHRFIKKFWRLYFNEAGEWAVTETKADEAALRVIHRAIKKVGDDIEKFAFNTCVSQFMIAVNELTALKCRDRAVLEALCVIIAPFAPHAAEELWQTFKVMDPEMPAGQPRTSVTLAPWPVYEEHYLVDNTVRYGIAINGKTRTEMEFPLDAAQAQVEAAVLADATVQKWLDGKPHKKIIYVKGKMINVVV